MTSLRRFVRRILAFLRPGRAEGELAREIASHRDLFEDDLRRQGLTRDEACAAVRRAFLGVEAAKDAQRDVRSFAWLEDARRDARFAVRRLAHDSGFTLAILLTLALGVGVATAVFSLVNAVVLRPLDYGTPDELVQLYETGTREGERPTGWRSPTSATGRAAAASSSRWPRTGSSWSRWWAAGSRRGPWRWK